MWGARASLPWPCGPSATARARAVCERPPWLLLDEVNEREDRDPHDVDEVPVQGGYVDQQRVLGSEPAPDVDREQREEPEHSCGHVRAVETRQREERRAEQVRLDR